METKSYLFEVASTSGSVSPAGAVRDSLGLVLAPGILSIICSYAAPWGQSPALLRACAAAACKFSSPRSGLIKWSPPARRSRVSRVAFQSLVLLDKTRLLVDGGINRPSGDSA